ncbi:GNAT family N-acetyltransferase [Lactobacillus rodentium]|uniref:GNAT family acetyltransferase n=1 Tax=Lactobacillus rodentium TaxID=947835 RepID=A0A2Z6T719_9LACO|nr:GNAT family N-acetyltransferase [Lactobacillus rodentium]MCR1894833.1 GNAT family N-acetyltransferase [Lactobacillus rodentium]GBG05134.1 GNAT family acetyltransferase [Lactobacillus rodentium]
MTSNYEIKRVSLNNLQDLQKISRLTFAQTFGAENSEADLNKYLDEAYASEKLTQEIENPNSEFYFIKVDNEVAGYLKVNEFDAQTEEVDPDALEIERIYLDNKFQHQGLGLALIQLAEKIAHDKNKKKMWLGVWEKNYNAQKFYEKDGFKRFSEHTFVVGNDKQTDYILVKTLV